MRRLRRSSYAKRQLAALLTSLWRRNNMPEDEAMDLAKEAQYWARRQAKRQ